MIGGRGESRCAPTTRHVPRGWLRRSVPVGRSAQESSARPGRAAGGSCPECPSAPESDGPVRGVPAKSRSDQAWRYCSYPASRRGLISTAWQYYPNRERRFRFSRLGGGRRSHFQCLNPIRRSRSTTSFFTTLNSASSTRTSSAGPATGPGTSSTKSWSPYRQWRPTRANPRSRKIRGTVRFPTT